MLYKQREQYISAYARVIIRNFSLFSFNLSSCSTMFSYACALVYTIIIFISIEYKETKVECKKKKEKTVQCTHVFPEVLAH